MSRIRLLSLSLVKEIYTLLVEPNTAAVALIGIGGIGKSTLASLVLRYAERERRAGSGIFQGEPVLLRINENTSFLELAANIFAAVGKPMPDLSALPPQNQAYATFNALNTADTADTPRLIILDQFENLLDPQSGRALTTRSGVGEFLDALNSLPCACRVLLTSRPYPHGTRNDPPAALRIYLVGRLDLLEGVTLLHSQGVIGTEAELREAVKRYHGHALSLTLLTTLLQTYSMSLSALLHEPEYTQLWEDSIAQNLLDRIFINLPVPSHELLCAFSVYREAVPVDAVQTFIPNSTKTQILSILGGLLEQHLIQPQISSGCYELHPIIATYALHHFVVNDATADEQARQAAHAKAAHYYLQLAVAHCPTHDKRRHLSDVQPLIEAVWQFTEARQIQEAYELMKREELFGDLGLWGENTILLDLCQSLLSANAQFTPPQQALLYSYLALTLSTLGQKPKALEYYEQALRISREVGDRAGEGTTLSNLGAVYKALGQKAKALEYYEQALRISREVGDRAGEGTTLHNLGMIFSSQRRDEVALACILLAKTLFEQVQSSADVDDEDQWINDLRKRMGEKRFASLLAQIEPRAEQIVAEALQKGL